MRDTERDVGSSSMSTNPGNMVSLSKPGMMAPQAIHGRHNTMNMFNGSNGITIGGGASIYAAGVVNHIQYQSLPDTLRAYRRQL